MAPYEAKYYSGEKIKNIGSLSQVSKIVWLRDSIEEIEVSKKIKKIGKWLQDEENIIVGEKKKSKILAVCLRLGKWFGLETVSKVLK